MEHEKLITSHQMWDKLDPIWSLYQNDIQDRSWKAFIAILKFTKLDARQMPKLINAFFEGFAESATPEKWTALEEELYFYSNISQKIAKDSTALFALVDSTKRSNWKSMYRDSDARNPLSIAAKAQNKVFLDRISSNVTISDVEFRFDDTVLSFIFAMRRYSKNQELLLNGLSMAKKKLRSFYIGDSDSPRYLKIFHNMEITNFEIEKNGITSAKLTTVDGKCLFLTHGLWYPQFDSTFVGKKCKIKFNPQRINNYGWVVDTEETSFSGCEW